jgi:hypothetical protein
VRWLTTLEARSHLEQNGRRAVLVDSSVLFHGVTHETAWISTGHARVGKIGFDTGYAARVPVHAENCDAEVFPHVRFLPGITHLARTGHLRLCTSAELMAEQFRQPIGRFHGYGYDDLNLFTGLKMDSVDGRHLDLRHPTRKQLERVAACTDPLYRRLVGVLGEKNSLDAYHIFTAERHGLFCFLHLDLRLDRLVAHHNRNPIFGELRTKIMLPAALGTELKLTPMSPRLLSYEDVAFFSRPDLFIPGQMRRPPKRDKPKSAGP